MINKEAPSYHDLYITAKGIERTSIFNLPYGHMITCSRAGGWNLSFNGKVIASEYPGPGQQLRLDVDGHIIVDSFN